MLSNSQAFEVVCRSIDKSSKKAIKLTEPLSLRQRARKDGRRSIDKASKSATPQEELSKDKILKDLGITDEDSLRLLQITIAADSEVGVPRLQHYIDPNALATMITVDTSIERITQQVVELAAGKLCSNPTNPHPQRYPYPANCPQCRYPVR